MRLDKKQTAASGIPQHEINSIARLLLPEIQKYFDSDEGKQEFAKWKEKRAGKEK